MTTLTTLTTTLRDVAEKEEETGGQQRSLTLFDASCRLPLVLLLSYAAGNVLKKKHHHHHHHHHSSSSLTTTKQHFVSRWCGRVQHLPQITSYMFVGMLSSASVREVSFDRDVVVVVLVVRFFFVCPKARDDLMKAFSLQRANNQLLTRNAHPSSFFRRRRRKRVYKKNNNSF